MILTRPLHLKVTIILRLRKDSPFPDIELNTITLPRRTWLKRYAQRTAIVSAIYFGMLVYPVVRVIGLILPDWQPGTPSLLAIMVLPILTRIIHERIPNAATRWLSALAMTWLGLCFQLFPLVVMFELVNVLQPLPPVASGWVLLSLIAGIGLVGFVNTQLLRVATVPIPGPAELKGRVLVQISDVHIGSRDAGLLRRIVNTVNTIEADAVLITGDLIDFAGISRRELAPLAEIATPTYFAIGNHERYVDLNAIDERLRALGICVLRNESVLRGPFQFIGVDDVDKPQSIPAALAPIELSEDHYPVLLYHRPDGFEASAAHGIPLMLAGHTHAGQIIPFNYITRRIYPRLVGLFELDGARMYVSPGTGTWGPVLRLGSRSEITRLEFV